MKWFSDKSMTLLLLTSTEVWRADLTGEASPKLKTLAHAPRPEGTAIAAAVELAISLIDAKPSRRTFVLAEEIWTGVIDLDDRSIVGLEGEELNQMLRFETETLSNLDPMHSQLGAVELAPVLSDTRRFWCTAVASEINSSIATAVSLRGGKLAMLANPIGLGGPPSDAAWTEFRSSLAGAFQQSSAGLTGASIAPRSRTSDRWYQSLETNFGAPLPETGWITSNADRPERYEGQLTLLGDERTLGEWAVRVAARLLHDEMLPVVRPPVAETSEKTFKQIAIAATVLAVTLCGFDYVRDSREKSAIQRQIAELEAPAQEKQRLEGEIKNIQKQIESATAGLQQLRTDQAAVTTLVSHNHRFSELLKLIARERDTHLVVDEISLDEQGLALQGRTIRSESANEMAMKISPNAARLGWRVQPPVLVGQNKLTNGGPWEFTVKLLDAAPVDDDRAASHVAAAAKN